jgi:hypothetical protein
MKTMSDDDFEEKIQQMREQYVENLDTRDTEELIGVKGSFFDRFRSREQQKSRLRRQLSELEVKKCRAILDKKSVKKLDQMLVLKKALFKKLLDEEQD